ncbi:hypothetical protein [Paramuribaculum intestinale]|uniref:hypothetical protein n=1 Tax=Paramuribaculum intestinale TaxID=2094151 RepID=UPI0025B6A4D8|nr:hypothetical protein [Paramuribaculum intestinale]
MNILTRFTLQYAASILLAVSATGCFTGIESTPKITANEKDLAKISGGESNLLSDIKGEPIEEWKPGKRLYVTDNKALMLFGEENNSGSLQGEYLIYDGVEKVLTITGQEVAEFRFHTADGRKMRYRSGHSPEEISRIGSVAIPLTIEETIVDEVRRRLKGSTFYIMTSLWYDMNEHSFNGRKFIPVKILDVKEGNTIYPVRLLIDDGNGYRFQLFMSVGDSRKAPRSFASLLSETDPRLKYPDTPDAVWNNIINGRVAIDMTRDQCRMAIGSPAEIKRRTDNNYLIEIWSYENGHYLMFKDGILSAYR